MAKQQDDTQRRDLTSRGLCLRADTINEKARTVEAVIATENPVEVYDWWNNRIVNEVLLAEGAQLPGQMPMLETHSRWSLDSVLGSVRSIRKENGTIVGTLHFADDERSHAAWNKVRDGHITDLSVGYRVLASETLKPGESKVINGRSYTAGVNMLRVATQWVPKEGSLVPIGADPAAKIREEQTHSTRSPAVGEGGTFRKDQTMSKEKDTELERAEGQPPAATGDAGNAPKKVETVDRDAIRQEAMVAERKRQADLRTLAGSDVPSEMLERAISEGWTTERAAPVFLQAVRDSRAKPVVAVTGEGEDRLRADLTDAICMRTELASMRPQTAERQRAADQFRGIGLHDLARLCLRQANVSIPHDPEELLKRAISTGTFTNVLSDSAHKSLVAAYNEYPSTFLQWAGTREVANFKEHKDVRLSTFASVEEVGNAGEIPHGELSEAAEVFKAKTYGRKFAITRKMWINDDMGAFTRVPVELGRAAMRNIDDLGYALLISGSGLGPTMAEDSQRLFYASRTTPNYITGATTVLDDTGLSALKTAQRKITGLKGEILNIVPRAMIVPAALEWAAKKMLRSVDLTVAKAGTTDATTVMGTYNPHADAAMKLIVEPRLDAGTNGTTAYYLACSPDDVPSLVVVFLRGNRTPTLRRSDPPGVLGIGWEIFHDAGVAAVDWRGIARSKGAA